MAVTSFKLPTSVIQNGTGVNAWIDPNNILLVDGDFASTSDTTAELVVGTFNLNIPVDATIDNFTIKIKGYRGSYNTTLQLYAVDTTTGVTQSFPAAPFQGFSGTNTWYTLPSTLFSTTWNYNQANNIQLKLMVDGELHVDAIQINCSYTPAVVPVPPTPPSGQVVVDEFVQGIRFQLAQSMTADDLYLFAQSFTLPDGTPIEYADFHGEALITVDQGVFGLEENIRITNIEHDYDGTGLVKISFGTIDNRGLGFIYPYLGDVRRTHPHDGTAEFVISNSAPFYNRFLRRNQIGALVSAPISVYDESTLLTTAATTFVFTGSGVTVTADLFDPQKMIVTIPGGGGSGVQSVTSADSFIDVNNTDPNNPVLSLDVATLAADPTFIGDVITNINASGNVTVVTDGVTVTGDGTTGNPLVAPGGGGGITSINGNTNAAQSIVAGPGISVISSGGTTTISNTRYSGLGSSGKPISFLINPTSLGGLRALNGYIDHEATVAKLTAVDTEIVLRDSTGKMQSRNVTSDWASANQVFGYVLLNGYLYIMVVDNTTIAQIWRYDASDLSTGGTLMSVSGGTIIWNQATAGTEQTMTSNGTDFFFNYDSGNSNNSYKIAKFSISGTTLTYVSTVTLGSTTPYFQSSWGVTTDEHYVGYYAGATFGNNNIEMYNSSATLVYTSGYLKSTNTVNQVILNWGNTFYYAAANPVDNFVKLYLPYSNDSESGGNSLLIPVTSGESLSGGITPVPVFIAPATDLTKYQAAIGAYSNISNGTGGVGFSSRLTVMPNYLVNKLTVEMFRIGTPGGIITAALYTDNAGVPDTLIGILGTMNANDLTAGVPTFEEFLNQNEFFELPSTVHVVLSFSGGTYNGSNYITMSYGIKTGNGIYYESSPGSWSLNQADREFTGKLSAVLYAGKVYRSSANSNHSERNDYDGVVNTTCAPNLVVEMIEKGLVDGFIGLTAGIPYYVSNTVGVISTSPGSTTLRVGKTKSTTDMVI